MRENPDYITLEEAAQALGRPVSWVKEGICRGELGGMRTSREWLVERQDLDKLMERLLPESDTSVHNSLAEPPPKKSLRRPGTVPPSKARDRSSTQPGASRPNISESTLRKRMKNLDKQIRETNEQIRIEAEKNRSARRSGRHYSKVVLNDLLLKVRQLGRQRQSVALALSEGAQSKKKQPKKKKDKKPKNKSVSRAEDIGRGRKLLRQIELLDRQIELEAARYQRARQKGNPYDIEDLRRLLLKRAALRREYVKISDPLGFLPPPPPLPVLVPENQEESSQ